MFAMPLITVFAAARLVLSTQVTLAAEVSVSDAWIRETPGPMKVSAGYAHITNVGAASDRLIEIKTPVAEKASIHRSIERNGMARMEEAKYLDVPARGTTDLKPGGYHIMLTHVNRPLRRGDTVNVTFFFQHAGSMTVPAKVASISATAAPP